MRPRQTPAARVGAAPMRSRGGYAVDKIRGAHHAPPETGRPASSLESYRGACSRGCMVCAAYFRHAITTPPQHRDRPAARRGGSRYVHIRRTITPTIFDPGAPRLLPGALARRGADAQAAPADFPRSRPAALAHFFLEVRRTCPLLYRTHKSGQATCQPKEKWASPAGRNREKITPV